MNNKLSQYTREQLESKVRHMVEFIAYKLATEYIELTEPGTKPVRTEEAERENDTRVLEHMVCVYPAWDVLESLFPEYSLMKDWVKTNHDKTLVKPCICSGCKPANEVN